jgi:5-methylcytosine-specific restriction endonuclease McrA
MIQTRRRWHQLCLVRWKIMSDPAVTRRFLWGRDKGKCCDCGQITDDWEADHDTPLRLANRPEHWQPSNLRTRCKICHKNKTRADWGKIVDARKS